MYKSNPLDPLMNKETGVIRVADNAFIPFDPDNTDYQAYLAWVAQGNTPISADEVTV